MEDHWSLETNNGLNCTLPAIDDFPKDLFTEEERQAGAIVLHALCSLYFFLALAVVCDKYFVPAVEKICAALNMSNDIAGATFMASATSAPELFVNVIGTFITEGDIGVGTIVGSAVFNILAVPACCGIGAGMVVPLDWWPLTRDCLAYGMSVAILIVVMHDERIEWYESLTLVLLYFVYIAVMYYDKKIQKCARGGVKHARRSQRGSLASKSSRDQERIPATFGLENYQNGNITHNASDVVPTNPNVPKKGADVKKDKATEMQNVNAKIEIPAVQQEPSEVEMLAKGYSLIRYPKGKSCCRQIMWFILWPIHFLFVLTIPDCEKWKKLYPLTFLMCIVWIGSLSYVVAWMITVIGDTLKIPDSVMGITFLAAGTSVPEAVSSVIVAKQGHGSMGISNSIGSNTFDILLCLGFPWLIKSAFVPTKAGLHWVGINSAGIEYSAITLFATLLLLYVTFACNKFKLDRKVGHVCLLMYAIFLIFASLIELNVFFTVNLPTCGRGE